MQIHELNEYPLNPSDGDWLIVDTGKDTAKVNGGRFAYKTDMDVLNEEIAKVITNNNGYKIDTLWTGAMSTGGDTATLSSPISNYDFIDIHTYFFGVSQVYTTDASEGDLFIRNQNIGDDTDDKFLVCGELKLILSAQTVGLEFNHRWRWSGSSSASAAMTSNDSEMRITKIVGRKCVVNQTDTEVKDIRIGADGTVYPSAGDAVRDQVGELDTRLSRYENIFTGDLEQSVNNWLDEHPEATTTVEDGSITEAKLADDVKEMIEKVNIEHCIVYVPFRSTAHQGDCTIIKCENEVILIDFGHPDDAQAIITYMVNNGLTKVTRCIITHFHYDHIGGYTDVIGSSQLDFSECVFYTHPKLDGSRVVGNASYLTYESDVTNYIRGLGRSLIYPRNDSVTKFNQFLSCRWLNVDPAEWDTHNYYTDFTDSYGNVGTSTNMNNFSVVSEFIHGNNRILLPGDLERLSEGVVAPYITETPVLYKQEHHGVNEVANDDYLNKINPVCTFVEGVGFASHYFNNPISRHLMENRGNIFVQAYGAEHTVFISDGYKVLCKEGVGNIINDDKTLMLEVTASNIDQLMDPGIYRINGLNITGVNNNEPVYGFMQIYSKGSFTIQDCIILNGMKFSRSYTTGSARWSEWHGDVLTSGTVTMNSTNVKSGSLTWNRIGNMVYITGTVETTAAPTNTWSTFEIGHDIPKALFTQKSNTLAVNASGGFTSAVAVTGRASGTIGINPRGSSCANKTFLVDLVYRAV